MKLILVDGILDKDINVLTDNFGFFELFKDMEVNNDDSFDMTLLPISCVAVEQLISLAETGELPIDLNNVNSTMYKSLYDTDMCLDTKADIRNLFDNGFIFNRMSLCKSCPDFYKVTVLETGIRRDIARGGTEPFYGLIEITQDVCENTLYTQLSNDCPLLFNEIDKSETEKKYKPGDKVFTYRKPSGDIEKKILALGNVVIAGGYALEHIATHESIAHDVDIFMYGITEKEANIKLQKIADIIKGVPYLTDNAYTFIAPKLKDKIHDFSAQVILRLYESPSEILHGFDIQACKVLMMMEEGSIKYYSTPSFIETMQYNAVWIDTERQSSTYALRLIKYFSKGFSVLLTGYNSSLVDTEIINNEDLKVASTTRGFALLLWLEKRMKTEYSLWSPENCWGHPRLMVSAIERICDDISFRKSDYIDDIREKNNNLTNFLRRAWNSICHRCNCRNSKDGVKSRWLYNTIYNITRLQPAKWNMRDPSSQTVIGSFHPEQEKYYHQAYDIKDFNGMFDIAMATL